jgi:diguanylate cyclase (GGDEF)-like protein
MTTSSVPINVDDPRPRLIAAHGGLSLALVALLASWSATGRLTVDAGAAIALKLVLLGSFVLAWALRARLSFGTLAASFGNLGALCAAATLTILEPGLKLAAVPLVFVWIAFAAALAPALGVARLVTLAVVGVAAAGFALAFRGGIDAAPAPDALIVTCLSAALVVLAVIAAAWVGRLALPHYAALERRIAAAERQVHDLTIQDPDTHAWRRSYMLRMLGVEKARIDRYGGTLSVVMLEIDGYADLIAQRGETAAEQVLREIADRVIKGVRLMDLLGDWREGETPVARLRESRFLLMLPSTPLVGANDCMVRVRELIAGVPIRSAAGPVKVTLSAGITDYADDESVAELVARAERALVEARLKGGNTVCSRRAASEGDTTRRGVESSKLH